MEQKLLDDFYNQYLQAQERKEFSKIQSLSAEACLFINTRESLEWYMEALQDSSKKWFVASIFAEAESIPTELFKPLVAAAVHETDPSFNRSFIDPCLKVFGYLKVNQLLYHYILNGTTEEKIGAINARYWSVPTITYSSYENFQKGIAMHGEEDQELASVIGKIQLELVNLFITNDDLFLRRAIIACIDLKETSYPDEYNPLIQEVIDIAQNHTDGYIRQRVGIQLGTCNSNKRNIKKWWKFWRP